MSRCFFVLFLALFITLHSFFSFAAFLKDGLSINLWRPSVATAVVDLILANTPRLRALDLGKNRIRELTWLSKLGGKIPLERLNLSENELGHPGEVDRLKSLTTLQDLTLTGNPLCKDKDFRNNVGVVEGVKYVDYVRKRLPGLRRLDGVDLPKVILFDAPVQAVQRFPPPVGIYVPSEELRAPLMKFVQDFFFCYDGRRQDLVQAYAEDAQFSLEFLRNSAT